MDTFFITLGLGEIVWNSSGYILWQGANGTLKDAAMFNLCVLHSSSHFRVHQKTVMPEIGISHIVFTSMDECNASLDDGAIRHHLCRPSFAVVFSFR